MATNFLHLATTMEYLGAKCLPKKKVNFVACVNPLVNLVDRGGGWGGGGGAVCPSG